MNPSYTGVDDGTYIIGLQVADALLTGTATTAVSVLNVAPSVDSGPDQTANEGGTVNFNGSFIDPGTADIHTIQWNFGDGTSVDGSLTSGHVFADNGPYTVTLTVTDDDGGVDSDTLTMIVNNIAPVAVAGPNQTINESDIVYLTPASFTDMCAGYSYRQYRLG